MSEFYDSLETRTLAERQTAQLESLRQQLKHAQKSSTAYAKILQGIDSAAITDTATYCEVPITRKSELIALQQQNRPFGGYNATNGEQHSHVFASPGPIYEPGYQSPDFWRLARALYASGFRRGDLVHNCFSYHLTPAGMMLESGALALGCSVTPAGVGQTELQLQTISDLKPRGYVGTPSFLKIILDKAAEMKTDLSSMTMALVSGEALPPSLRAGFSEQGIRVQQCYATADLGLIGYESSALEGLIIDEGIFVEIVRPGTGEPVAEGEVGEVVVTSFNAQYPLIRFATGDLSAFMPGASPCGRSNQRIKGWMGRADQTAKVRGMFIHPQQIDKVIKRHSEISRARLVIDWIDQADKITLKCEASNPPDGLESAIAETFRSICKLRGDIELQDPGSLANDGKVIDDIRKYD